jgi:pilus assembly protein CpaC
MHRTNCLLRTLVWGTLLALLVSGLPTSQAQEGPRPSAVIVAIGGTVRLQMKNKRAIKTVVNPKENVVSIRAVAGDPTTILITGQQPDVTTIELTDVNDVKETYEVIVQLDVEYLRTLLRRTVPTANVTPIPSSNNAVILTGTVTRAEDVSIIMSVAQSIGGIQVINGMRVGGVQQVQLDVLVASVSRSLDRSIGFDGEINSKNSFFGSFVSQNATLPTTIGTGGQLSIYPNGGLPGTPAGSSNFLFGVLHSGWGMLGFLQALKTEGVAKFITQPSLVTLSGRPATFLVGGDQAVPVVGGIGGATGVQFEPFGTQLTFLPVVLGNGKIYIEVSPSITDLDAAFGTVLAGNVVPGRRRTSVNATVQLEAGQTFVIGGLTRHITSASSRRVPLLGEMPFLGTLFSNRDTTDLEEELIILVTPHLVDPQDCNQVARILPGQETRNPDDFELYLEGILEAPRGSREVFQHKHYVPAYKNSPSTEIFPCAGEHGYGKCGVGGCGSSAPAMLPPPAASPVPPSVMPTAAPLQTPLAAPQAPAMLPPPALPSQTGAGLITPVIPQIPTTAAGPAGAAAPAAPAAASITVATPTK